MGLKKEEIEVEEIEEENTDNAEELAEGEEIEDGEESEPKVEEAWQKVDEEDDEAKPVKHLKAKKRLQGVIKERDDENDRLRAENETLRGKASKPAPQAEALTIPLEHDFDEEADYRAALEKYHTTSLSRFDEARRNDDNVRIARAELKESVDNHYDRVDKLLEDSSISPDVYKEADATVRRAIEAHIPGHGDAVTDNLIKQLGEGSEKVIFYLGRNKKTALAEFQNLLATDKTGIKAAMFLGEQKAKLTKPRKMQSKAPAPAAILKGGALPTGSEATLMKKYNAAHKKGNAQEAWKIRSAAKKAGVEVSKWN